MNLPNHSTCLVLIIGLIYFSDGRLFHQVPTEFDSSFDLSDSYDLFQEPSIELSLKPKRTTEFHFGKRSDKRKPAWLTLMILLNKGRTDDDHSHRLVKRSVKSTHHLNLRKVSQKKIQERGNFLVEKERVRSSNSPDKKATEKSRGRSHSAFSFKHEGNGLSSSKVHRDDSSSSDNHQIPRPLRLFIAPDLGLSTNSNKINEMHSKRSPEFFKRSPEFFKRSPEFFKRSPEFFKRSPEFFKRSPEFFKRSPEFFKRSPEFFKRSPEFFKRSPEFFKRSPEFFKRSPEFFKRSPEFFKRSPEFFKRSPEVFKRSPEFFKRSPEFFKRSPEFFKRSPEFFKRSPEFFKRSPEFFKRSPEFFKRSPEFFKRSPEVFKRSFELHHHYPDTLKHSVDTYSFPETFKKFQSRNKAVPDIPSSG